MISMPTTEQVILDCRRELLDVVLPAVTDEAVKVAVQMLENVLLNTATRSAHEIAWMIDEAGTMISFARDVGTAHPGSAELDQALSACGSAASSLHLHDVVHHYNSAGDALSCAIETAMAAGDHDRTMRATDMLEARVTRELQITGEWGMVGRG